MEYIFAQASYQSLLAALKQIIASVQPIAANIACLELDSSLSQCLKFVYHLF